MLLKINDAKEYIESQSSLHIDIAVILGSGLGDFVCELSQPFVIRYDDIPHFPVSTVKGHMGQMSLGQLADKNVLVMQGRFHYYEGYTMQQITFPVRVIKALGIDTLIVTNAAGGLRKDLTAGSLMIIEDHINMMGSNPLIGKNYAALGERFPDMSDVYNKNLIELTKKVAAHNKIDIKQGVYAGVSGPMYETKAELKMLLNMGADAVGMSTVPEVIVAKHAGMNVLALSCITDSANPDTMTPLSHEQVIKVAEETKPTFTKLLKNIIAGM